MADSDPRGTRPPPGPAETPVDRWRRRLLGPIPGPESQRLVDDLARYECPAITARRARRGKETGVPEDPIVWRQGRGAYVEDCYPTDVKIAFARALAAFVPGDLERSIFGQSGSEAVEAALETAAMASGRRRILAFHGAYHGLSHGALAVSAYHDSFREPFAGAINHRVTHAPYPNCYRCPFGKERQSCGLECLSYLRYLVENPATGTEGLGAVIVEPIQGRGGCVRAARRVDDGPRRAVSRARYRPCPRRDLHRLRAHGKALRHGALRYPARHRLSRQGDDRRLSHVRGHRHGAGDGRLGRQPGESIHTSTFLGNPMGCAVGLKAIEILEREAYDRVSAELGQHLLDRLGALKARFPDRIGDVRGHGLLVGAELVRDATSSEPDGALALGVMQRMLHKGVLLLPSGPCGQVLSFTPPFVITRDEIDEMMTLLEETFTELCGGR